MIISGGVSVFTRRIATARLIINPQAIEYTRDNKTDTRELKLMQVLWIKLLNINKLGAELGG